jgi:hypothetical protein
MNSSNKTPLKLKNSDSKKQNSIIEKKESHINVTDEIEIEKLSKINSSNKENGNSTFERKWEKKERCYVKDTLNKHGQLYILDNPNSNLLACKIKIVNFPIKKELFDKGKELDIENYLLQKKLNSIPDIKFWNQRYYYFTKFDEGVMMDYESWYSVTPEELAIYTAKICGSNAVVVDAFCGPGGNVIQVRRLFNK